MQHCSILLILLGVLGLSGCATNEVTGADELRLMSQAEELKLGAQQYPILRQQSGGDFVADPELVQYVQTVGARLAAVADRDLPYEFVVINAADWNAWALPGGKIGINRGLLLAMETEAELAAVLAHEIVHAAAGHGANQNAAGQLGQLGLEVLGALIDNPVARQASAQAGSLLLGAGRASFSRADELEADRFGMEYMLRAGYDLQGAVDLQQRFLEKSNQSGASAGVNLFATHPPSQARVIANRNFAQQHAGGEIGREAYQAATKRLKITQAAYDHLERGVAAYLEDDMNGALARAQQALKIEAREPAFYELKGFSLLGLERFEDALKAANMAIRLNPNYYRHYNLRARIYRALGREADARADYQISQDLFANSEASKYLGQGLMESDPATAEVLLAKAAESGDAEAQRWLDELRLRTQPADLIQVSIREQHGGAELWLTNRAAIDVTHVKLASADKQSTLVVGHTVAAGQSIKTQLPASLLETHPQWHVQLARPRL